MKITDILAEDTDFNNEYINDLPGEEAVNSRYYKDKSFKGKDWARWEKIINYVKTNCSDIYNLCKSTHSLLYRGIDTDSDYFIGSPPTNRQPIDPQGQMHQWSKLAYDKSQVESNRSNSIFTLTKESDWGIRTYVVFPFNGFKYSWFEAIDGQSFYHTIKPVANGSFYKQAPNNFEKTDPKFNLGLEKLSNLYNSYGLTDENLEQALRSPTQKEILISGAKYVAILYDDYRMQFDREFGGSFKKE